MLDYGQEALRQGALRRGRLSPAADSCSHVGIDHEEGEAQLAGGRRSYARVSFSHSASSLVVSTQPCH